MTYAQYTPEQLDQLVLQILDLTILLREMSLTARKNKVNEIPMHDRKAIQWCESLEQWARKSKLNLDLMIADLPRES